MSEELKPCPFCGGEAHIEQVGNRKHSTIYECGSCGCRLETSEEFNHGGIWNHRADQAERDRLAAELEVEEKRFNDLSDDFARLAAENAAAWNKCEERRLENAEMIELLELIDPHIGTEWVRLQLRATLAKVKESAK